LEKLVPLESVKVFVDMIIHDIGVHKTSRKEARSRRKTVSQRFEATKSAENELQYMDRARMTIAEMLGIYMAICDQHKYEILEYFKVIEMFKSKEVRKSFLQNILECNKAALYQAELAKYMTDNFGAYKIPFNESMAPERIVFLAWVDCNVTGSNAWEKRLLVLSHRVFYVLKESGSKPCTMCGDERFCPKGPKYVSHFSYDSIEKIIKFKGVD
jgi:hypothetical protein